MAWSLLRVCALGSTRGPCPSAAAGSGSPSELGVGAASLGGSPLDLELRDGPDHELGPPPPGGCYHFATIVGRVTGSGAAAVGRGSGPGIRHCRSVGRAQKLAAERGIPRPPISSANQDSSHRRLLASGPRIPASLTFTSGLTPMDWKSVCCGISQAKRRSLRSIP